MWEWTPEQQAIIDRIQSGQTDFTFGPGSPNPTHEDIHTYVGGKYSPAGGFAVDGGVALAPKEYNMFTPEQRRQLGIMDIAPKDQVGKIERYYGSDGMGSYQFASGNVPSPTSGGTYAGSNVGPMVNGQYAVGTSGVRAGLQPMTDPVPSQTGAMASGIGGALSKIGQAQIAQGASQASSGSSQALAMLMQRKQSALASLLPPISSYGYG